MRFFRSSSAPPPRIEGFQPPLRVVSHLTTRMTDAERGPLVRMNPADARLRLLSDDELAWVQADRGQQLATTVVDEAVAPHTCVLRDVPGVSVSEAIRVVKPDLDTPRSQRA